MHGTFFHCFKSGAVEKKKKKMNFVHSGIYHHLTYAPQGYREKLAQFTANKGNWRGDDCTVTYLCLYIWHGASICNLTPLPISHLRVRTCTSGNCCVPVLFTCLLCSPCSGLLLLSSSSIVCNSYRSVMVVLD